MKTSIVATVGLVAVLGCGQMPPPEYGSGGAGPARPQSGARPAWVDGQGGRYGTAEYLTGVGRGLERMPCENDARAALAKVFVAQIQQVSADWQGHFSRVNAVSQEQVEAMAVSQLTRVSTDYVLKGARIAEIWRGPQSYHCLAVLDRWPAARSLNAEIDRLDTRLAALVREGDRAATPTARFMAYRQAMELLQRREALNAELRIVHPSGTGKPAIHGWEDLVAKFTGAQQQLKIGLELRGRDGEQIQTCLIEELSKREIRVVQQSSDVDLMVHGDLKWRRAGYVNGSYMVKVDLSVHVTDVESGQTVAAFAETLKTGRPQLAMALQSASTKICLKVAPLLAEKIVASLSR